VSAVQASGLRPGALRVGVIGTGIMGTAVAADGLTLIADPQVDAVVIASNDATHAELAVAAIRAGKPVLCQKPLAPTLSETAEVVRVAEAEGPGLLSVGFMRRFDPGSTSESSITGSAVHEFDTVPWLLDSPIVEVFLNARYGYAADWRPRFADAYRLQLQAWVDSVVAGTPFLRRCPRRAPPTRWPPRRCAGG
jgi:myo-inositol 2-dehydrogenase / D-chiro-inositol 1-dehydrogenase